MAQSVKHVPSVWVMILRSNQLGNNVSSCSWPLSLHLFPASPPGLQLPGGPSSWILWDKTIPAVCLFSTWLPAQLLERPAEHHREAHEESV